ncbi:MAG TPA: dihydrolipoamide acetyltransferase family protein [Polyangiaceae bacterium]|jgi:2-oxoglutarate dehydrogenase E2 component (dihydrolipoamide succinyltransferase)|nr:dihydrolipoamide acetyltransferase family protein [Polyangiaceae bacterium]
MLIDVTLPQLGESVSEGTISKWLVREGDAVVKDQPLVSIATDKADSELPAPVAGRVAKLLATEGQVVPVKAVIAQIEEGAGASASTLSAAPGAPVSLPPPAAVPPPAPLPANAPSAAAAPSTGSVSRSAMGAPLATPNVRKTALENDVDLDRVHGTGERGRVTRDDVLRVASGAASPNRPSAPPPEIEPPARATPQTKQLGQLINQGGGFVPPIPGVGFGAFKVPAYRQNDGDKVVPFTRRRRITADHMTYSKFASPHVVTVAEVDLHKASKLREAHKERYKAEGMSLTMLAFVVVATARALRENPQVNARVLDDAYVVLKDVNLGVAVDSPDGLVVPVVRRADELGIRGIVRAIDDIAKRAKAGKITIDDLSGATFSVSNPGLKGNLFGGAIINQPNVGILRMGEIQKRVVVVEADGEDHMAIHPVMFMALSYDHRVVDGVAANSFLWRVTEILEKADFDV